MRVGKIGADVLQRDSVLGGGCFDLSGRWAGKWLGMEVGESGVAIICYIGHSRAPMNDLLVARPGALKSL